MKEIEDFLAYIGDVRGLAENTVKSYRVDLEEWAVFLDKIDVPLATFSADDAKGYVREMMAEFSERSVLRKLTALRTFYGYLERRGVIDSDPFSTISMRRKESRLPSWLASSKPLSAFFKRVEAVFKDTSSISGLSCLINAAIFAVSSVFGALAVFFSSPCFKTNITPNIIINVLSKTNIYFIN